MQLILLISSCTLLFCLHITQSSSKLHHGGGHEDDILPDVGALNTSKSCYQVIIIGGGFGGMSAALNLGRALTTTLVISAENPRNKVTDFSHNYYTRDGTKPATFLRIGKKEILKYSEFIDYTKDFVTSVAKKEDGKFEVKTKNGKEYHSEYLMFATGQQDDLTKLDMPGLQECYGKSVWHCPFCDGYNRRNKSIAAFALGPNAAMWGIIMYHWSSDLVVFTKPGKISATDKAKFVAKGIKVVEEKIVEVLHDNGYMKGLKLESGAIIPRKFGFLDSTGDDGSDLPKSLGITKKADGTYETVDTFGKTSVPGVWIIGDLKDKFTGTITAASQGNQASSYVVRDIMLKSFG